MSEGAGQATNARMQIVASGASSKEARAARVSIDAAGSRAFACQFYNETGGIRPMDAKRLGEVTGRNRSLSGAGCG